MKLETTPNGIIIATVGHATGDAVQNVRRRLIDDGVELNERTLVIMDGREMLVYPAAGMSPEDASEMTKALAYRLTTTIH
ncbi:hypothetical protein [Mesorhizobium sp. A623]